MIIGEPLLRKCFEIFILSNGTVQNDFRRQRTRRLPPDSSCHEILSPLPNASAACADPKLLLFYMLSTTVLEVFNRKKKKKGKDKIKDKTRDF